MYRVHHKDRFAKKNAVIRYEPASLVPQKNIVQTHAPGSSVVSTHLKVAVNFACFFVAPAFKYESGIVASHSCTAGNSIQHTGNNLFSNTVHTLQRSTKFWLCLLFAGLLYTTVSAQNNQYPLVRTPQVVAVNHTLPEGVLAPEEAVPAKFSKNPTDEEIYRVHFFEEPLVALASVNFTGENNALVVALAAYSQRKNPDDFSSVTRFLNRYPNSRWRGSLLANLGIVYRRTGYYNQALDAWQTAWQILKSASEKRVKVLADKVVSELLLLNAWVGRFEEIEPLLKQIDLRVIEGPAGERIASVREALLANEKQSRYIIQVWSICTQPVVSQY